jgi:hypothetical protein
MMKRYASIALGLILTATLVAGAKAKDYPIQIKVLSAESHQIEGQSERAMEGCPWREIDAYCYSSEPETYTVNSMIVQQNGGKPFCIECTAYRWSNCTSLPVDKTFPARQNKRGIAILYSDKHGKQRMQLYEIVSPSAQSRE